MDGPLLQLLVFLGAAAVAAPFGRWVGIGSILGYLLAGIAIGQTGLRALLGEPAELHQMAELGVAMFLFLIGLELRPRRLWSMRQAILGAGGVQVAATALIFTTLAEALGQAFGPALLIGLALSLSSTVFALQTLDEKGELTARHGRLSFSVLLFQDIAAIPMIALVPLFAMKGSSAGMTIGGALQAIAVIAGIIFAGHFVLNRIYRAIAATGAREAMTAVVLLTVVGVVFLMDRIGMSASLGAFLAGILLADSEYRHQIEADIAPFEGLLLGLFFVTVGMSLNLNLVRTQPGMVLALVAGIVAVKAAVLYVIGHWQELGGRAARRFAIVMSQGGEFAFVILAAAATANVVGNELAAVIAVAVTLSMATTPVLLALDGFIAGRQPKPEPRYDTMPKKNGHVVIAGFGRFGQIVARVLRATGIPFTALDISAEQVNFVNQFGNKIYYGDASRLGILDAAQMKDARAFVLAIDDVETSLRTAEVVRAHFPQVPIYARARNRQHVHALMDLGVENIERETFLSALDMTKEVLHGLGTPRPRAKWIIETFKEKDERRLYDDYKYRSDTEKLRLRALKQSEELAEIFAEDIAEDAKEAEAPQPVKMRQRR